MRFSDSINLDTPKRNKYDESDSSPFTSDTSSSDDESSKTFYPPTPDTSLNDISFYKKLKKLKTLILLIHLSLY